MQPHIADDPLRRSAADGAGDYHRVGRTRRAPGLVSMLLQSPAMDARGDLPLSKTLGGAFVTRQPRGSVERSQRHPRRLP